MSAREFRLPDLGEGLTESDLVTWHVAAGDRVELNQVIAEVETAKALVDLPSPYAGVVAVLHAEPGQTVNVGEPLVTFEVPDEAEAPGGAPASEESAGAGADVGSAAASAGPPESGSPGGAGSGARSAEAGAADQRPDDVASAGPATSGGEEAAEDAPQPNLVGYGARPERSGRPARRARRVPATPAVVARDQSVERGEVSAEQGVGAAPSPISREGERPRSTPPVRRLAKQLGVHIERIVGSGARGLVTREDVLGAVSCAQAEAREEGSGAGPLTGRRAGTGRERNSVHGLPSTASGGPHSRGFTDAAVARHDVDDLDADTRGSDDPHADGPPADEYPSGGARRSGPTSLRDLLGQSGLARAAARRANGFPPPDESTAHGEPAEERGAAPSGSGSGGETRMPVRGVRKHTAAAMVASAFTAPQATVFLTVDVTPSRELLDRLRTHPLARGARITVLALVARALCAVLPRHPSLASRWEDLPDGTAEIVHSPRVNLGIAVATDRGLVAPHVPDAHTLGLVGLAEALADLTATARDGRTAPERLTGGTITITNVGVFGVDAGTPILVPGEAAILGVGAVRERPWEHEGQVALRDVLTLSLTFDHRVVDGEQGARFLAELGALLADPALALLLVGDSGPAARGRESSSGVGHSHGASGSAGAGGSGETRGPRGRGVAS